MHYSWKRQILFTSSHGKGLRPAKCSAILSTMNRLAIEWHSFNFRQTALSTQVSTRLADLHQSGIPRSCPLLWTINYRTASGKLQTRLRVRLLDFFRLGSRGRERKSWHWPLLESLTSHNLADRKISESESKFTRHSKRSVFWRG